MKKFLTLLISLFLLGFIASEAIARRIYVSSGRSHSYYGGGYRSGYYGGYRGGYYGGYYGGYRPYYGYRSYPYYYGYGYGPFVSPYYYSYPISTVYIGGPGYGVGCNVGY